MADYGIQKTEIILPIDRATRDALILGGVAAVALWYVKNYQSSVSSGKLLAGNVAAKRAVNSIVEKFPAIREFLPETLQ